MGRAFSQGHRQRLCMSINSVLGSWKLLGASQRPCRAALLSGWGSPLPPSQGPPFSPEGIRKAGRPREGRGSLPVLCPSAPSDLTLPLPGPMDSSARKDKGRGSWGKHGSPLPCSPEGLAGFLEGSEFPTLLPEKPAGRREMPIANQVTGGNQCPRQALVLQGWREVPARGTAGHLS